jgi:hypothetical protein
MIKTALDKAKDEGYKTVSDRIIGWAARSNFRYVRDRTAGNPVYARIDWGRWIADCECGGAEMVDPGEPLFFCCACGNSTTSGRARKVVFPNNRIEVENKTMEQPDGGHQSWNRGE